MKILLSIKRNYADLILKWEKIYEIRRLFTKKKIDKIVIYESAPTKRVVGECNIEEILYKPLDELWNITKWESCVDKEFFYEYFKGKEYWYAIKLKAPKRYKTPKSISEYNLKRPPQNYCFIN